MKYIPHSYIPFFLNNVSFFFKQMDDVHIRGRRGSLHFIRFPTSEMGNFLSLAKSKGMAQLVTTVCATGGGAFKFENNFKEVRSSLSLFINK